MPNIAYLTDTLQSELVYSAISKPNIGNIQQTKFIKHFNPQVKNTIYVGSSKDVVAALTDINYRTESLTFVVCDDEVNLSDEALAYGLNVICVSADIIDTYDKITQFVRKYTQWRLALLEVANQTQSIQEIVRAGSQLTSSSIFLLNKAHQVVYSTTTDSELTELLCIEMSTTGRLSEASMRAVDEAVAKSEDPFGSELADDGQFEFFKCDITKDDELFYTLILTHPKCTPRLDATTFLQTMSESIDLMTSNQNAQYWAGEDFKSLLNDLIDMKIVSGDEISRRLSMLSIVPQKFVSFLVIEFETPEDFPDPPAYFITQVEDLFPNSNACILNNSIVVMFGRPDRSSVRHGSFDDEKFVALLAQYHAYAAISTPTSHRAKFRQTYLLAQRIMSLAKKLRPNKDDRVFLFEDYADYLLIDLCYPSFVQSFGHDDMVYLTHPDVIQLFRYDSKYNDNLLDVLYYYCLNDLNIVKTAKAIFMHRNTIASKLKKIDSLIYEDLTDGQVQQRIIISYKILRYMNLYIQVDLTKQIPAGDYV